MSKTGTAPVGSDSLPRHMCRTFVFKNAVVIATRATMNSPLQILGIVGPTASGKSELAIELARAHNGEVISADSRQVYRGLDIGTAKVPAHARGGVPHHLIDIADIGDAYAAAHFVQDARKIITRISRQGRLPVIAGGTLFYYEALRGTRTLSGVAPNHALRESLALYSTEALYTRLRATAPTRATHIDPHNRRRLIRAIEVSEAGRSGSHPPAPTPLRDAHYLTLALTASKETLRARYEARAQNWLANGFLKEVRNLREQGVSQSQLQEIGFEYTLALALLDGEYSEETFIAKFIEKNWQYAKRQNTWLAQMPHVLQLNTETAYWRRQAHELVAQWRADAPLN